MQNCLEKMMIMITITFIIVDIGLKHEFYTIDDLLIKFIMGLFSVTHKLSKLFTLVFV